jgi:hypothetical protein
MKHFYWMVLIAFLTALKLEAAEPKIEVFRYLESGETEHLAVKCHAEAPGTPLNCQLTWERQGNLLAQNTFPAPLFRQLLSRFKARRKLATASPEARGREILGWSMNDGLTQTQGIVRSKTPASESMPAYELDSILGSFLVEARLQKRSAIH